MQMKGKILIIFYIKYQMFLKNMHKQFLFGTGFSGAYFLVRPPRGGISTKERTLKCV